MEKKKSSVGKIVAAIAVILVVGAAGGGAYWYINSTSYVTADSAKINGDISSVSPKIPGKVSDVKVSVGSQVKKGDVLFTLETDQLQIQLSQASAALDIAKTQLAKAEGGARSQEVAGAQAMVDQAQAALNGANTGKTDLQNTLNDLQSQYNTLLDSMASFKNSSGDYDITIALKPLDTARAMNQISDGQYTVKAQAIEQLFASKGQLEAQIKQIKAQLDGSNAQIAASKANLNAANSKLSLTNAGAADQDKEILEDQVKTSQANYDLVKLNLDNAEVKSPIDGTVVAVNVLVGDTAAPGQGVVSIVDLSKLNVLTNIKEDDISKIKEGQSVKLSVDAFPGVNFTGKVTQIGLATESAVNPLASLSIGSSSSNNELVPVKVSIDAQGRDLKPGLSVTAKVSVK